MSTDSITTSSSGLSRPSVGTAWIASTTRCDASSSTSPKIVCLPCSQGVALSFDQLGLELAQTALAFGADALWGELDGKRTLPLLGSQGARRQEIEGLVARSGRRAVWIEALAHRARQGDR